MRTPRSRAAARVRPLALLFLATMTLGARAEEPHTPPKEASMLGYHVSLTGHHAHRVSVRLTIQGAPNDHVDLSMPVWTPGSYLIREYARHVLDLAAQDDAGNALPVSKRDKNTWRVESGGAPTIHVDYTLYANERSVRTSHVDSDHAFLSPAGTFLEVSGRRDEPHHVSLEAPADWRVFTALAPDGDGWRAEDFDILIDSPIEVGPHEVLSFEHAGVPHRIVLAGEADIDTERLTRDVATIVAEVAGIFDVMPFDDYTFIVPLVDSGGGGLEHLDSSVCMANRWDLVKQDKYRGLLALIAHEYFHAWNVKRFRPESLGPFDYDRENYTRDLWVAEGITSYYDDLCTLRAGFADKVDDYLEARAMAFRKEAERPGSQRMSLAHSSFDAWIKLYRPDENSTNSSISYYTKGALVALMLDLRIRRVTGGARCLADALRLGWQRYTVAGTGFPDGAVLALSNEVAGTDLRDFFEAYVTGTVALDPDPDLAWVGLQLQRSADETKRPLARDDDGFALEPWLGVTTRARADLCVVDTVLEDAPAFHAGLNHDDVILAVNDMRVSNGTLQDRLDRAPGDSVRLTIWRGQSLRSLDVLPEMRRLETWKLVAVDDPTAEQKASFEAWTRWHHPADGGQRLDDPLAATGADGATSAPAVPSEQTSTR